MTKMFANFLLSRLPVNFKKCLLRLRVLNQLKAKFNSVFSEVIIHSGADDVGELPPLYARHA